MYCSKICNGNIKILENEKTVTVKFRTVVYKQVYSKCDKCDAQFFTPQQLDLNNARMKEAYNRMTN